MRSFHLILLPAIFIFGVAALITAQLQANPVDEAKSFLKIVASGNTDKAIAEFGDNTCHCAPKGGYGSYLKYVEDPSIAFLVGRNFLIGATSVKPLPYNNQPYTLPWDKPEDVAVRVKIDMESDPPTFFLPLDSAFGHDIALAELQEFEAYPQKDWWKAFSLRLRSTLQPGLIVAPSTDTVASSQVDKATMEGLVPPHLAKYLHARDAGSIILPDKQVVPLSSFQQQLPKLKSITIGLKIVRAGLLKRWAVKKIGYENPVLLVKGHSLELSH